jgi:hypothetical protein
MGARGITQRAVLVAPPALPFNAPVASRQASPRALVEVVISRAVELSRLNGDKASDLSRRARHIIDRVLAVIAPPGEGSPGGPDEDPDEQARIGGTHQQPRHPLVQPDGQAKAKERGPQISQKPQLEVPRVHDSAPFCRSDARPVPKQSGQSSRRLSAGTPAMCPGANVRRATRRLTPRPPQEVQSLTMTTQCQQVTLRHEVMIISSCPPTSYICLDFVSSSLSSSA